jgi:hypothetical protein
MTGKLSCNIKCLVLSLLLFTGINASLFSQIKTLGGTINKYARVTTIGADYVVVSDAGANAGQFADFEYSDGDTVLLIQMKGVRSYITEDASFGDYEGPIGTPGQHEFIIIDSVESATKKIIFKRNISDRHSSDI